MFKIIERTANYLKKLGVEDYDIYAVEGDGTGIEVKNGEVDRIKVSQTKGVAIRVVVDGRLGFAYTNDVSDDGIRIAIECAKENAKCSEPDDYSFSMPEKSPFDLKLTDDEYENIPTERKIELAKELESLALRFDGRVKRVRKASYGDGKTTVYYYNSNDLHPEHSTCSRREWRLPDRVGLSVCKVLPPVKPQTRCRYGCSQRRRAAWSKTH